jgi:phosphoglycolate phosphatase
MKPKIKGLLFDKDGTLFDFNTTWAAWSETFFTDIAFGDPDRASEMAAQLGYHFAERRYDKDSIIIAGTPQEVTAALHSVAPDWSPEALLAHVNKVAASVPQAEPVPLIPLMQLFRANGMKLGVATNDAEAPAQSHLARAGITGLMDFIAGFDSGFGAKPGTGMQEGFCARVGLNPGAVAMVGDSLHDLHSGRAAGMVTIGVLTGMADRDDLSPHADVVLNHIGEIPDWLGLSSR